ncbi:hypothetical protein [Flavobacterium solisilvae]|uniref:hypothetical protein n=1 Tax=Flavobacterium solisilvae TaxID=1852019 RepID=UPI001B7CFE99|nr:hypothetical protein [Flavobacterium solisilvae]
MGAKKTGFESSKYLILFFCFLSFSISYSQIDISKDANDKKFKGSILSSQKQGDYLEESKIPNKKNDTITFLYNNENIAKLISIKNEKEGITNDQFHKYASEINPKFHFHSKLENRNATIYFNEEKTFANIKVFSDSTKSKVIEIGFISGQKLIQKLIPNYQSK